jgi:hypothetical protein
MGWKKAETWELTKIERKSRRRQKRQKQNASKDPNLANNASCPSLGSHG